MEGLLLLMELRISSNVETLLVFLMLVSLVHFLHGLITRFGVNWTEPWLILDGEGLRVFANFGLPGCYSDHASCTVTLFEEFQQASRPFKFFNMWTQHE